ncbi:MAG: CYTH domain-containing protein [Acidobacteriota bacterium]
MSAILVRELRFADVDLGELRTRLAEIEAEKQGPPVLEDHWFFDREDRLQAAGRTLRLCVDKHGSRLIYRGRPSLEGRTKVREDIATSVGDEVAARALLEALEFEMVERYQIYREEWLLGSIVIALDHTPVGDFAGFEGDGCETVARRAGLDPARAERRDYLRLLTDHRREHPETPRDLLIDG